MTSAAHNPVGEGRQRPTCRHDVASLPVGFSTLPPTFHLRQLVPVVVGGEKLGGGTPQHIGQTVQPLRGRARLAILNDGQHGLLTAQLLADLGLRPHHRETHLADARTLSSGPVTIAPRPLGFGRALSSAASSSNHTASLAELITHRRQPSLEHNAHKLCVIRAGASKTQVSVVSVTCHRSSGRYRHSACVMSGLAQRPLLPWEGACRS